MNYSAKEELIYQTIRKMMETSGDIQELRMSDIAAQAGIGKGTLYLYFNSKEELIIKTLLYIITQQVDDIRKFIRSGGSSRHKCIYVLKEIARMENENHAIMKTILSDRALHGVSDIYSREPERLSNIRNEIYDVIFKLVKCGEDEGILPKQNSQDYVCQVVVSVASGYICMKELHMDELDKRNLEENAYQMMIKALSQRHEPYKR